MKALLLPLLGLFTITAFAEPVAAPVQKKLFLLIGQSNMAGRGKVEPQDQVENPHIFMLTKDLKWVAAKDPVHFDKPAAGVGPSMAFAREFSKADPTSDIGLIPCAVGGTSLDQWKAGGPLYTNAVTRAKEAMKEGKLAGILWHQGESDSGDPAKVATYVERFTAMIAQLRKDLGAEDVPLVFGELIKGHKTNDSLNAVLPELLRYPKTKIPNCALVSSEGLGKKALHFESADARQFGQRYAAAYLELVKGKK